MLASYNEINREKGNLFNNYLQLINRLGVTKS